MAVDPAHAKGTAERGGKTYSFCCEGCATKFRAQPGKYLNAETQSTIHDRGSHAQTDSRASASRTTTYVCPMDPEVRQDSPGACPKCGMALGPAIPPAPATRIEYTCPMHPQIVRTEPSSCPICGMALEPRTVVAEDEENPELTLMTRRFWTCVALTIP